LCTSIVGTAFAGPIAEISGLNKQEKRVVRKISRNISKKVSARISNRKITVRASRLAVAHAKSSDTATNASNASNASNAANAANWERFHSSGIRKVGLNQTVVLGTQGPFTFFGRCTDLGGNKYRAETFVTTAAPKSMMSSYSDSYEDFDFEPGLEAELGEYAENTTPHWSWDVYSYDTEWTAIDPSGTMALYGGASNGVHVLGSPCAFHLWWYDQI
jgi:hypothetical protein